MHVDRIRGGSYADGLETGALYGQISERSHVERQEAGAMFTDKRRVPCLQIKDG
jgi:hypothetical protein